MSDKKGLLTRLRVKLTPQFVEDWIGAAGRRFRKTTHAISDYNSDHLKLGERVDEAPDLLWRAAQGASSVQHAKAEADYAKAENERIEAELKRRTLAAKTRHEVAEADRAEAEAGIARIREIQARLELYKQLRDIGVGVTIDSSMNLVVTQAVPSPELKPTDVLETREIDQIEPKLIDVKCPDMSFGQQSTPIVLNRWIVSVGSRVEQDQPIYEVSTPAVDSEIPSLVSGVIVEIIIHGDSRITAGQILAKILPEA